MKMLRTLLMTTLLALAVAAPGTSYAGTAHDLIVFGGRSGNLAATRSMGKAFDFLRRGLLRQSPVNLSSGYFNRMQMPGISRGRNLTYIRYR